MAKIQLIETDVFDTAKGGFCNLKVVLNGAETSNIFILPENFIDAISVMNSGTAKMYGTNYSLYDINNDTALYAEIDMTLEINPAITAFYFVNTTSESEINVRIRIRTNA